jgi:exopolysaccharide biosynthesis polyprenyl glycosylphosphotransferase
MGITVCMALDLYDFKFSKTSLASFGTLPVLIFHSISLNKFQLCLKRVLDIAGSIVGLLITAVLSIIIIPLIILDSPGPVFFKQQRVGKNGRTFELYKFRTMSQDAEMRKEELAASNAINGGLMFKIKDDPRVTRIGKFIRKTSIDELPQFLNVLKGDMSLVGTRPPTIDEVSQYKNHHLRRISIKPGLTGAWQISGRSTILDFEEVVRLDTEYIDNWSIGLDLKIIIKTIFVVFKKTGAF